VDPAWLNDLLARLGARYKTGQGGREILYRSGKTEFHPSRIALADDQGLELAVDVRVPKDAGEGASPADALVAALDRVLKERGFARAGDEWSALASQTGQQSGGVRSLRYRRPPADPEDSARQIRAVVESLDIPLIVGIHEPDELSVRDPPPPGPRPGAAPGEALERWRFRIESGLLRALAVEIDPNDRTLRVLERRGLSTEQLGETMRLAQVARLVARRRDGKLELVAVKRDGSELRLLTAAATQDAAETCGRLAKQARIPFTEEGR
jgi:hypothetical protein